jgi:galactonate dehydratase
MTIADYELFELPGKSQLLKLETSDGLVGWGEPVLESHADTSRTAVEELLEGYLLGEDPARIEHHWQRMYRGGFYRGGPVLMSAIAGIDQALWDIKGKRFGAPAYELLGGRARDRVQLYQWTGGETPAEVASDIESKMDRGFSAFKMNVVNEPLGRVAAPGRVADARERVLAAREAVGDDGHVAVDFHGRVHKSMARRVARAIEDAQPLFVEEPVTPDHDDAFPRIAASSPVPIATGERLFSRWDFKPLFEADAIDVAQPDLSHAGGITECKKIADAAESYDVALAPHCPLGPVALAACLQVDACAPNFLIQEQSCLDPDPPEYVANPEVLDFGDGGYLDLPEGPGLGIEVDEDVLREHAPGAGGGESWTPPEWRHDDGGVAEQ